MENVPSAVDLLANGVHFEQVKGKRLLPLILDALQRAGHNPMHLTQTASNALIHPSLRDCISGIIQAAAPVAQQVPVGRADKPED